MSKFDPKQINLILAAPFLLTGVNYTSGAASQDITSNLTTLASSLGYNGTPVPVQEGNGTTQGFAVNAADNNVGVWGSDQQRISDASGNEVYGRLTRSGTTYLLKLYVSIGGTETAYVPTSTLSGLRIMGAYYFALENLRRDAFTTVPQLNLGDDVTGSLWAIKAITPTATNTLPALTYSFVDGKIFKLIVNGQVYTNADPAPAFTVSGTTVTWNSSNAGFNLTTSDTVIAEYQR